MSTMLTKSAKELPIFIVVVVSIAISVTCPWRRAMRQRPYGVCTTR
jgi:hypothetical protein